MSSYQSLKQRQRFELEIKRSRFISTFERVNSIAEAKAFVHELQQSFPDANHNCWAYIAGHPNDFRGVDQSDDGEPKGTAGKPMLNVLQHSGLGNIACVVTRYFGGIKLGAGGLVRAYSQAVSEFLPALELETCHVHCLLSVELPYASLGASEHWLAQQGITIQDKQFTDKVVLILALPEQMVDSTTTALSELCFGNIRYKLLS